MITANIISPNFTIFFILSLPVPSDLQSDDGKEYEDL